LYTLACGIFSALGYSKTHFIFLVISSVLNIGLDLLFVCVFHLDVAGAAWATLISQAISCVLTVIVLMIKLGAFKTEEKPKIFDKVIFKALVLASIPVILQQSFVSVGNLFIQSLINSFEMTAVTAASAAAVKLNTFSVTMFTTLAGGVSNYTAQNLGAGKTDRVRSGFKSGLITAEIVAVIISLISVIFPDQLIGLFVDNPTETVIATGRSFLRIISPFYFTVCAKLIADNILRGSGTMVYFMISTFTDLILRVVLAYVFSGFMGVDGVWWSWPVGWGISACLSQIFYFKGLWLKKGSV
ncbi:MAG: polysaccharide biosynthesis C-terminal domain-containing protein, partial [Ruminiclostridium sp.]|nr:polysaccharide biosynthesis C-terminal domain-containing protein [Ruminiclostridium sp.]